MPPRKRPGIMAEKSRIMIDYIPAVYRENKHKSYVEYYVIHPSDNKLRRKQIRVDRIKSAREKKKFAKRLAQKINLDLSEGWNPFLEQEMPRALHRFSDALKEFLSDKKDLRPDTLRDYKSVLKFFKEWLAENFENKDPLIINFTVFHAMRYMEDQRKRGISNLRYNNILARQRLLFNWMKEHYYTKINPFEGIRKRRADKKKRCMDIDMEDRKKIREYLTNKNKMYWNMCMLAFHSLLRPKEITYVKASHINISEQTIFVNGSVAKNHNDRICTIPDVMINDIKELLQSVKNKNYYLFGRHFQPGAQRWDPREISRYWAQLREILKLDSTVQFYSLRDSGIVQKLRDGLDPATVKELADHSSLEITNKYVKIARQKANQEAKEKSSRF